MTRKLLEPKSLLINEPFALRQIHNAPVFTKIKTTKRPHTEQEINVAVNNINNKIKESGLTHTRGFETRCRKFFTEAQKKIRHKEDFPINLHRTERIILTPNAKGYISTAFLEFAKEHSIAIYWIDVKGKIEMSLMPFNYKKPELIMKQYNAILNGTGLDVAKYLVKLKLESQNMERFIEQINKASDIKTIIRIEGSAQDLYYEEFAKNFNGEWQFRKRCGRNQKDNKNAVDSINTMLNLGYGILAQQMSEILLKRGFELSMGFLHSTDRYWNQLSYDFIEPYRVWIDNCVKEMIAENEIKPSDFTFSNDKSHMVLKDKGLEIAVGRFLEALKLLEFKSLPVIRTVESML